MLAGTLVLLPLAAACGGGDHNTEQQRSITVGDLQRSDPFFEGKYLGRTVTVSAAVSDVHGPFSFDLSGGDLQDDTLLVMTDQPAKVARGQLVRVTGTGGQLHFSAPSEGVPYIQKDLYDKHSTKPYLYDASVEPLPGTYQARSDQ